MGAGDQDTEEPDTYVEPGAYDQPGSQQDDAQPLDHRALDDETSAGKKASEDLHGAPASAEEVDQ